MLRWISAGILTAAALAVFLCLAASTWPVSVRAQDRVLCMMQSMFEFQAEQHDNELVELTGDETRAYVREAFRFNPRVNTPPAFLAVAPNGTVAVGLIFGDRVCVVPATISADRHRKYVSAVRDTDQAPDI